MKFTSKHVLYFWFLLCALHLGGCAQNSKTLNYEQTLTQAQSYLSSGQIQSAVIESQNLIQADPNRPTAFVLLGDLFFAIGDYKQASKNYQLALDKGVPPAQALELGYQLTDSLIRLGRLEQAQEQISAMSKTTSTNAEILRLKADIALTEGRYEEAVLYYNRALKQKPKQSESLLGLAIAAQAEGDIKATTDWLTQALDSKADFVEAQIFQGFFFLQQDKPEDAEAALSSAIAVLGQYDIMTAQKYQAIQGLAKAFVDQGRTEEALELNKTLADSPQGKVQQGIKKALTAYQQGDVTEAEKGFEQVLSLAPDHQLSNLGLGMLKLQDGDIEAAEHLLSQASNDLNSLNEKAFKALTLARLRLGKNAAALDILKSGLERYPLSDDLHLLQASTLAAKNKIKSANTILDKLIAKNADNTDALSLKAHLSALEGNIDQARQLYIKSIQTNPDFFPAYRGLLSSFEEQPREAQKQMHMILSQQNPKVLTTELALGIAHLMNEDTQTARDLGRALFAKAPKNQKIQQFLSNTLYLTALEDYKNQRLQPAYIQLKEAIEIAPSEKSVTLLTRLAVELQRPDEAVQLIQELVANKPKFALGSELLGDLSMASNKNNAAIQHFNNAWATEPNFRLALKLFNIKKTNSDLSDAIGHIKKWQITAEIALEKDPKNPELQQSLESALFALATANEQQQQHQDAIKYYLNLVQLQPKSPVYLNNIAWLKLIENQEDALEYAEKAYGLAPETGEIIDTYAWILVQKGDIQKGIELLQVAAKKSPNNSMIKQHLQQAVEMQSKSI